MTGLWPHQNGCTANNIPLNPGITCFPEISGDRDYRTGYLGKWHLGDEIFAQHGFEEWEAIEDQYIKYYSEGRDRNAKSAYCRFLLDRGLKPDTEEGTFSRDYVSRLPLEYSKTLFLENRACSFLENHRKDPFILFVNFLEPHPPYSGPLNDLYDPETLTFPPNFNATMDEDDPLRYRLIQADDKRTEEEWRSLLSRYMGLITQVDRSIGRILGKLEDLGLAENTIVVYTSDHGDMMGSHGLLGKTVMYEEAVRIPLIMRYTGKIRPLKVKEPAGHISLVPTLLELMGKKGDLPGTSLVSRMRGGKDNPPVFIEWNPNALNPMRNQAPDSIQGISRDERKKAAEARIRTIITPDGWKLALSDLDKNQLFNLEKDPWEMDNLYRNPLVRDKIRELRDRILKWQKETGDTVDI